jgi:AraC-like DNA-binding protein
VDKLAFDMKSTPRRTPVVVSMPPLGISAFTSRHASEFRMPEMSHSFEKICLVEAGSGELQYGTERLGIATGFILRVPAQQQHRFVDFFDSPMTLSVLCVETSAMASPLEVVELWQELVGLMPIGKPLLVPNAYLESELRRLFRCITLELGLARAGREAVLFALAIQLLVLLRRIAEDQPTCRVQQPSPAFLSSVAELEDRFADPLQIKELAKCAGMCYRSYTENFRRHKGMTVTQYITQRRIEFSQRRMIETGDILGSALESGFRDLSHFYRIFKRYVGHTPLEFIRFNASSVTS